VLLVAGVLEVGAALAVPALLLVVAVVAVVLLDVAGAADFAGAADAAALVLAATFAVVEADGAALAALDALAFGSAPDGAAFATGFGATGASAGATLALAAAAFADVAAARAAATTALALVIAAMVSGESSRVDAAGAASSAVPLFFLQADSEPVNTTAHITSDQRDPMGNSPTERLGFVRSNCGASCRKPAFSATGRAGIGIPAR
jgi:hypothetical protein